MSGGAGGCGDRTLVLMVGLPRAGKTTEARRLHRERGWPVVCPDAVRLALHGQRFAAPAEPFVWAVARCMVRALFLAGHDAVILDATNGTRRRRDGWKSSEWRRAFVEVLTPKDVCLSRAAGDPEVIPVIERMAAGWEPVGPEESDSAHTEWGAPAAAGAGDGP